MENDQKAGFLYFLEGQTSSLKPYELEALKIPHAWVGEFPTFHPSRNDGPGGNPGLIITQQSTVKRVGFFKAEQTWFPFPDKWLDDGRRLWCGYFTDSPPTPESLAHKRMIGGKPVTLEDGGEWMAPIARKFINESGELAFLVNVPTVSMVGTDGKWGRSKVVERYAAIWDAACKFWDNFANKAKDASGEDGTISVAFDFDEIHSAAATMLSANYRVGPIELSSLQVLSERRAFDIMNVAVDMDFFRKWLATQRETPKGNEGGQNTAHGCED